MTIKKNICIRECYDISIKLGCIHLQAEHYNSVGVIQNISSECKAKLRLAMAMSPGSQLHRDYFDDVEVKNK